MNLPGGIRAFCDRTASLDKAVEIYPQMFHELHNDLEYDRVLGDLGLWLTRHL